MVRPRHGKVAAGDIRYALSMGMLQLPPVVISTPLKLLLFVMVDGWGLLIGSLMRSFS